MKKPIHISYFVTLTILAMVSIAHAAGIPGETVNCDLTSITDNKQRIDVKQYAGKVVYVDFWASWCGPCTKSFPFMNYLDHELKSQGLQVIGVNLDENIEEAKQFLDKFPASFTVVTDTDQQCAKNFGVKAMPSAYLVDRKGIIRNVHAGFRPGEAEEFRVLIEQLLAESTAEN